MKEKLTLEFENNDFKCYLDEQLAIIKVKCNAFYSLSDLEESRKILHWFDLVAEDDNIKAILILNEKGCLGNTAFEVFVSSITGKDFTSERPRTLSPQEREQIRSREVNVLNSFIIAVISYRRLVISGLRGTVVTPFLGASLASDFRFASGDTVFSLSHVKYGLHAGGALPFFLPKYVGLGKASEYVFNGGEITASEALNLGLINNILPENNFDDECIKEAKKLTGYESRYMRWSKELLIPFKNELIDYLHREEKFIENY